MKNLRKLVLLCLVVWMVLRAWPAAAQTGNYLVSQNGHDVGTASFTLTKSGEGWEESSLVNVAMQGLAYAISKTERMDKDYRLQHVILSGILNGSAVSVVGKPDGAQFLLNISANGRSTTTRLDAHSGAVFVPDFDAGALETLLELAAEQNDRDLWAIIPKQAGSVVAVELATYPDEQGTLDGKAVTVHHLRAAIAGGHTELFEGAENELLQAELPQAGFALVRKGFVLTMPKKPVVPAE